MNTNVYIYCEGQTEEAFANEVLAPYFWNCGIYVRPIICETKRTETRKTKGGVSNYHKIKKELSALCKEHSGELVTTMFDYYAMPKETPGINSSDSDIFERIEKIENAVNCDIGSPNCKFHFMLHEFEGILFSKPESFSIFGDERIINEVRKIKNSFATPEHINNSHETAPSKRLKSLIPGYAKVTNGILLAKDMGIDVIMSECPHFKKWIKDIVCKFS